jgi:hypothetical protein
MSRVNFPLTSVFHEAPAPLSIIVPCRQSTVITDAPRVRNSIGNTKNVIIWRRVDIVS